MGMSYRLEAHIMDKKHQDALDLTRDELLAKLRGGRPANLGRGVTLTPGPADASDAPTTVEVKSVAVRILAPTLVRA